MTTKPVRIGCIGCGWIMEHAHIPAFLQQENVRINSLYDTDITRARRVAEHFGIEGAYDDLQAFLHSGIDAVIVATPNSTHAQYAMQAIGHGLHVLCEKPVAVHSAEIEAVVQAAREKGVLFVPGFVNRFRNDINRVRSLLSAGGIGEITRIDAGWLRRSGVPRPGTWFTHKAYSGGGVLIDLGSHIIDLCLMMLEGKSPLTMELSTSRRLDQSEQLDAPWFKHDYSRELDLDVEDTAFARIVFDNNALLHVRLSWKAPIDGDCTYFHIYGTKGSIHLQTLFGFSTDRLWEQDSLVLTDIDGAIRQREVLDREEASTRLAFTEMARAFVEAVRGLSMDRVSPEDGRRTVACIEQLYAAERVEGEAIWNGSLEALPGA